MLSHKLAPLWAFVVAVQAGCGGGGGGAASAPPPPPPTPPSIDASALRVAQQAGACTVTGRACIEARRVYIDDDGEITAFWVERSNGSAAKLTTANLSHAGTALMSQAVLDADFNNRYDSLLQVNSRNYLYLNQHDSTPPGMPSPPPPPGGDPTASRLVALAASGLGVVSSTVTTPQSVTPITPIVRDFDGKLSAIVTGTTAPFPNATLGGNVSVALVSPATSTFAEINAQTYSDFKSIAPRALWGVLGKQASNDVRSVYINQISLSDGSFIPIGKASQQEVRENGGSARFCLSSPAVKSTAVGEFSVAWMQQNAALNGCDLIESGAKVNSSNWDVYQFQISGSSGFNLAAVWTETDPVAYGSRLRWSQRDPTTLQWSAAAPVDVTLEGANHYTRAMASGPGRTLAVVWESCTGTGGTCTTDKRLVSKYVNGAWATRSMTLDVDIAGVAINAAGQVVVLGIGSNCGGSPCTELSAYRF